MIVKIIIIGRHINIIILLLKYEIQINRKIIIRHLISRILYLINCYFEFRRNIIYNIVSIFSTHFQINLKDLMYYIIIFYVLFTTIFFGVFHARVALDVTTPVERATTLFGPGELMSVVPASATHQITSVHTCAQN